MRMDVTACLAENEGLETMLEVCRHQARGSVEHPLFLICLGRTGLGAQEGQPKKRDSWRHTGPENINRHAR